MKDRLRWTAPGDLLSGVPRGAPHVLALDASDMGVAFQPVVDAQTGDLFAHEVLARCRHEAYRNPTVLFAQATEQGASGRLGRLIREVAFERGAGNRLFVNLHPQELESRWLVRPDDPIGLHDREVYLEITESAAFQHFELCRDVLTEVCSRTDARLVVDDFGAGYSNLLRVLELNPAIVKLDGSLVRGVDKDRRKHSVVAHMVALCADLGAKVVAECVETVEELSAIRDTGASYVQGYLVARPGDPPPDIDWPLARQEKQAIKLATLKRSNPAARARRRSSTAIPAARPPGSRR